MSFAIYGSIATAVTFNSLLDYKYIKGTMFY